MVNDIIEIEIKDLNINFEGIGEHLGKKICVRNVLPHEVVKAKVVYEKQNFIFAKLIEVIVKNPLRIEPKCKHYNICGGCSLQILTPKDALKLKHDIIKELFLPYFNGEVKSNSSSTNFYYRNKVTFAVKDNSIVGLKQDNTNSIVQIEKCVIANNIINQVFTILKNWLKYTKLNFKIQYFVIRSYENNFILTIVTNKKISLQKELNSLIEKLKQNFNEQNFGIFLNVNKNKNENLGKDWQHVFGLKNLLLNFNSIIAQIHPYSFLQVNFNVMQKLYNSVLSHISKNDIVIEGYSGAGLLSALISKRAKQVYSIEINKEATNNANELKQKNNIINLENINGSCSDIIPNLKINLEESIFVLDPPQSGCDTKILDSIIENKIKKIIYVSCNPYTLKQNVHYLKNHYEIDTLEIFDMFPNTSHIETLCILKIIEKA